MCISVCGERGGGGEKRDYSHGMLKLILDFRPFISCISDFTVAIYTLFPYWYN